MDFIWHAQGTGNDPLFEGSRLAEATGSVVVTINYRLGPLGFLVHDGTGKGGMHGLGDAILALKWVQHNAAAFGGKGAQRGCGICGQRWPRS